MGNIEFIPIQLEHASGKSMWFLKNCTSISVSNHIFSFQSSTHRQVIPDGLCQQSSTFFAPKGDFFKRNPVSTLASLSTSRLIFVGKVSMLRGCERWRRKAKPRDQGHHKAIEGTSWLGIRFCCKKSDVYHVTYCRQYEKYETKLFVYIIYTVLEQIVETCRKICTEML